MTGVRQRIRAGAGRQDALTIFSLDSRPSAPEATGRLMPRPHKARKAGGTVAGLSLVLQAAAELSPAPLASPAACLEAEGLHFILEVLMVHGPVVLRLTEGLGQDGMGNQHGELGNFREDPILPYPRATAWSTPFPVAQTSHGCYGHPHPWYRVLWEKVLVAAFEDIHLRIVEAGVVVGGSVSFPDETAPATSRGVGVRAGCAVGCIRGPAPCTH